MQRDLLAANPATKIRLLGVNNIESEGGVPLMAAGHVLPLLQDPDDGVWKSWAVTWRDVVVLDAANRRVTVFNLTEHDLREPANYASLLAILKTAAGE